jgi:TolB-like protein/Flp pilus assembly protein TadD
VYPSAVREQLERVLAHSLFKRSARMGRFLRLAVEQTLAGKAGELKEYLIGVEVFDRKAMYDPRVDPIVRVEARRLRSKLTAYYQGDGRNDAVTIEFVAGSYAPQIGLRTAGPAEPEESCGNTIAVLPFADLSATAEYAYLSDGLTEELIHVLTTVPGMRVVAWNSAARLRERQQDLLAIRQQLHAATALTGSVRVAGPELRVRAQLIDTESGVYLWSETFDRAMQDVFAIQEEIARAIVRTLRVHLAGGMEEMLVGRGRSTLTSYDWYLKGRYAWNLRSPEGLAEAIRHFEAAIAADGRSALPHAGLADSYSLMVDYGLLQPESGMPRARAAATRALALDPGLAEAYTSLGFICSHYDRQWQQAECLYQKAIQLNPSYATAHHWLGVDYYLLTGRFDQALAEIQTALQLDPLSSILHEGHGYVLMIMGRNREAVDVYHAILEGDPTFCKAYTSLGRAHIQQGNYGAGIAMLEKGRSLMGEIPSILGALGQAYGLSGEAGRARELLASLRERSQREFVSSTPMALIHLGLGENEQALDCLEKGCAQRELPLTALGVHPAYDALRGEPRFAALLHRLGLR